MVWFTFPLVTDEELSSTEHGRAWLAGVQHRHNGRLPTIWTDPQRFFNKIAFNHCRAIDDGGALAFRLKRVSTLLHGGMYDVEHLCDNSISDNSYSLLIFLFLTLFLISFSTSIVFISI